MAAIPGHKKRAFRLFVLFLVASFEYFSLAIMDGTIWNRAYAGSGRKPLLDGIVPDEARNNATVNVDIIGENFTEPATLSLVKNWRVILALNVEVIDSTHINCDFPLKCVSPGEHDLIIQTVGGTDTLKNGFLIKGSGHHDCDGDDDTEVSDDTADDAVDDVADDVADDTAADDAVDDAADDTDDDAAGSAPVISGGFWEPEEFTWSEACESEGCTELLWDVCDPDNDLVGGDVFVYESGSSELSFLFPVPIPWSEFAPQDAANCEDPLQIVLELTIPRDFFTVPGTFRTWVDLEVTDNAGHVSNSLPDIQLVVQYEPTTTTTTTVPPDTTTVPPTTTTVPSTTTTTMELPTTTVPATTSTTTSTGSDADDDAADDVADDAADDLADDAADDVADDAADDVTADDAASDDAADDLADDVADDAADDDAVIFDDTTDDSADDATDDDSDDESDDTAADDADDGTSDDTADDATDDADDGTDEGDDADPAPSGDDAGSDPAEGGGDNGDSGSGGCGC